MPKSKKTKSKKTKAVTPTPTPPKGPPVARRIHLSEVGKYPGLKATVSAPDFGIKLNFENATRDAFNINLTGGVLHPQDSDFQRLLVVGSTRKIDGVYLPAMNVGHCVFVPPASDAGPSASESKLQTCCMDAPKAPPSGNRYNVSDKMAPDRLVKASRAFCAGVSLPKEMVPCHVTIDDIQQACWHDEDDEGKKEINKAIASGKF